MVAHHHLERLRELQRLTNASDGELDAVLRSYGATDLNTIAQEQYTIIVTQLNTIHAQREQMKELLISALEIGVETALTIITGGAIGGALIATLGAKLAGIIARDLSNPDYDPFTVANLQDLAISIASLGTGQFTNSMISTHLSSEVMEQMSRSQRLMTELWRESQNTVINTSIEAAVRGRMPSADAVVDSAFGILTSAAGSTAGLRYSRDGRVQEAQSLIEHMNESLRSSLVSSGMEQARSSITSADGQSSDQLVSNAAIAMGRAGLSGLNGGLSSYGSQQMGAYYQQRREDQIDESFNLSASEITRRSQESSTDVQSSLDYASSSVIRRSSRAELESLNHLVAAHGLADEHYRAREILESDSFGPDEQAEVRSIIASIRGHEQSDTASLTDQPSTDTESRSVADQLVDQIVQDFNESSDTSSDHPELDSSQIAPRSAGGAIDTDQHHERIVRSFELAPGEDHTNTQDPAYLHYLLVLRRQGIESCH